MAQNLTKDATKQEAEAQSLFAGVFNIHGAQVINKNIELLEVKEWVLQILPRLEITFADPKIFFDFLPLQDNDLIEFNLSLDQDSKKVLDMQFRLMDFENNIIATNYSDVRITGYQEAKEIFNPIRNRAIKGSSSDVVKKIASEAGLEVDIRVNANDNQIWYQTNMSNYDMLNHVMNRAYVRDNDAVFVYVDRSGKMIYTSLQTQLKKEDTIQLFYDENRRAPEEPSDGKKQKSNAKPNQDKDENIMYFDTIKFVNKAGFINRSIGYGKSFSFDKVGEKQELTIDDDSHAFTDFSYKDKEKVGLTAQHQYFGMLAGNMHDNYYKALVQNQYYKTNYFNSPMLVTINPTDKINIFDIINLRVPLGITGEVNESYSGKYIVGGIHYYLNNKETPTMLLALFRNGINKNGYIEDDTWHLNN
jgi:hypothetical protein